MKTTQNKLNDLSLFEKRDGELAPGLQFQKPERFFNEENFMKNWITVRALPVYLAMIGLTAGCAGTATSYTASAGSATTSAVTATSTPVVTSTTTSDANAPLSFSFQVTGAGGVAPTFSTGSSTLISTDNLLQVQVTAGPAGEIETSSGVYSAYSENYGCVTYTVSVLNSSGAVLSSKTTETLAVTAGNDELCPSAPTNQTLDFSAVVDSGTHGGVYVQVVANQYDYYCLYAPYYGETVCPLHAVYMNGTVTGSLSIQTNGTSLD